MLCRDSDSFSLTRRINLNSLNLNLKKLNLHHRNLSKSRFVNLRAISLRHFLDFRILVFRAKPLGHFLFCLIPFSENFKNKSVSFYADVGA